MTEKLQIRWLWGLLLLLPLLASSCTTPLVFQGQTLPAAAVTTSVTAEAALLTPAEIGTNRLLILGADGNLFTTDPDGRRAVALTTDASPTRFYSQPTWSPSGERIAWTRIDDSSESHLIIARSDGTIETDTQLPFPPFYYAWNSSGDRLAYLSNWRVQKSPTLALRLIDMTTAPPVLSTIATGQPLYFSWSPTGDFLLTHTGNREVAIASVQGRSTILTGHSGNFGAPQWLANPVLLAYTVLSDDQQQMVIGNLRSGQVENLVFFNGSLGFSISPDGHKLAYTDSKDDQATNSFGPLLVLDRRSNEFRQLSSQPVIAFFWSPDSSSLFYMAADLESEEVWLQLFVWDGEETVDLGLYQPSTTFVNQYLRFGDQYSQSAAYWSPDSRSVLFAGRNERGGNGIWVIPADGSEARRVARGVYATWTQK